MDRLIGKEVSGYKIEGWKCLDKDSVLVWCESQTDCEGDEYRMEVEYWNDEDSWVFTRVYEHVIMPHGLTGYDRAEFISVIAPVIEEAKLFN